MMTNIILFVAMGVSASAVMLANQECTTKNFAFTQVEVACNAGGRSEAKQVMKQVIKQAKAAGVKYKCNSCHNNLKTFELKDDAIEKMKPWLK